MLLLLTLALLASSTCRAQNVLGNNVGTYFYVRGEDWGELKGMQIFLAEINVIKGIQLQFGNYWSDVYGSRSPDYTEFLLEDGEHVIKMNGTAKLCLTSLSFTTNKGRVATFGVRRGRSFDDSGGSDKHLVTVHGVYTPGLCITETGFKWGYINDEDNDHDDDEKDDDDDKVKAVDDEINDKDGDDGKERG